ncbi:MAG TPA: nuclear transport factor 2 family protein [Paracoccaceae bacterium]|nr:nuclear transport factor 2 family protein [Paracoccaceae bacterium]
MPKEKDEIVKSLRAYIEAANGGDSDRLAAVLHPEFRTGGQFEGAEVWMTRDDALAAAKRNVGGIVPDWTLEALEIRGRIAVARISSPWQGRIFRETITLLHSDDRWRIVFKAFDAS